MDRYEFILTFMGVMMTGAVVITLISTVGKVLMRRKDGASLADGGVAQLDERLSRMEQAIDAMAVEMERVSEGQRFATRLLAERAAERVER